MIRVAASALALVAACRAPSPEATDVPASPQASAEPAPLAAFAGNATTEPRRDRDGGPTPPALRTDRPLASDPLLDRAARASVQDGGPREPVGLELDLVVHAGDVPAPYRSPEVSTAGLEAARRRLETRMHVELAGARARFVLEGAWPLAAGTGLRARSDRLGYVVVLPQSPAYHVAAAGALRALLGERRLDVAPLSPAEVTESDHEATRRLGLRVRRADVVTRAGRGSFELARVDAGGEGGALLCRVLLDLLNAAPSTPLCAGDEVPLHAELRWSSRSGLVFDAVSLVRRPDLTPTQLLSPPAGLAFRADPLPGPPFQVLLLQPELAAFRTAEVDVPAPTVPLPADVVGGLVLSNQTDELRFVWIDGLPVAYLTPGSRMRLAGLRRGRYVLEWRTFLGDAIDPPVTVSVPGASLVDRNGAWHTGMADAGVAF